MHFAFNFVGWFPFDRLINEQADWFWADDQQTDAFIVPSCVCVRILPNVYNLFFFLKKGFFVIIYQQ